MRRNELQKTCSSGEREKIFTSLQDLYRRSWNGLARKAFSLDDTRALSDYITQVRMLLKEWGQAERGMRASSQTLSMIDDLKAHYQELEGMVKEARNDLQLLKRGIGVKGK